jgi:ParB family chromosome partitioning protein
MKKEVKNTAVKETVTGIITVSLSKIVTSDFNPRRTVAKDELQELADSIKQVGVLQPVLVRPKGRMFEIVCGERRYRASELAKTKTIPAIVRTMTDDEALEAAITENLIRVDITPIEEAVAYKKLADTGRYDVNSLAVRFGKSETYIRNRMRLNDLTDELLNLVGKNVISVSVALELCKYGRETQTVIFEKHLQDNPDSPYNDWRNLTGREFIKRLENNYCADLNRYHFDRTECAGCPFNSNCYTLFPEENKEGKCLNFNCLTERNRLYLVETCKNIIAEHPGMDICKPNCNGGNEDVYADLSGQGFTIDETSVRTFPEAPETPDREDFEDEAGFEEAKEDFYSEMAEYRADMENIEQMFTEGKAKRIVTIRDNAPQIGYVLLNPTGGTANRMEETATPAEKLEKQDRRNREIAVEKIVDDTRKLIRETEIPQSDLTGFEDTLLYFIMLGDLKREHFTLFLEKPQNKWYLTDEDKITIINSLTEEQKTVIRRDFLVKHLSDTSGLAKKSYLMLEFARLHFPYDVVETETRYNEVYQKRHARIAERLEALNKIQDEQKTQKPEIDKVA